MAERMIETVIAELQRLQRLMDAASPWRGWVRLHGLRCGLTCSEFVTPGSVYVLDGARAGIMSDVDRLVVTHADTLNDLRRETRLPDTELAQLLAWYADTQTDSLGAVRRATL